MSNSRAQSFLDSLRGKEARTTATKVVSSAASPAMSSEMTVADLLDSKALLSVNHLEMLAQTTVNGVLSGKHRSTHKGGCTDFSEHRPYSQGDDLRRLDWKLFARNDRYYVKQYDDETNLQALIVLDVSGSMRFGLSTVSKFDYARLLVSCLARLLVRQRDSVGVTIADAEIRQFLKPKQSPMHLQTIMEALIKTPCQGSSRVGLALLEMLPQLKRKGMVIVVSDFFTNLVELKDALTQVSARGHDVMLFEVLAPEEISFDFRYRARFEDLEQPSRWLDVDPGAIRGIYLEKMKQHRDILQQICLDLGCDLHSLSTQEDLGEGLAYYLRKRAFQNKMKQRSR